MREINVGIIGWGFMGRMHAHALRAQALYYPEAPFRVRIAGICSGHAENARRAAEDLDVPFWTGDYRELLARKEIDAVSVCTPNDLHEEIAIAAMRAGKAVYIDKPLADTAEAARRIADVARETGAYTQMVFNNRYFPATLRARELVEEGRIGNLMSVSARYLHSGSIDPNKPIGWKQTHTGGVLLDLGSHALDLLTWLCGYPEEILCAQRRLYDERPLKGGGTTKDLSEDHVQVLMRMPGGALGTMEASKIATGSNDELTIEIRGDKGALRWDAMDPSWLDFFDQTVPEAPLGGSRGFTRIETVARYPAPGGTFLPPKNAIGWDRGHAHCYFTFLDRFARGLKSAHPVEEGARLQALMECAKRSAEEKKWIQV